MKLQNPHSIVKQIGIGIDISDPDTELLSIESRQNFVVPTARDNVLRTNMSVHGCHLYPAWTSQSVLIQCNLEATFCHAPKVHTTLV